MAKQMSSLQLVVEVPYASGVRGTPKLAQINYAVCDSSDPTLVKPGGFGVGDNPAVPRDITGADLAGTLQTYIDGIETDAKAKEGVA